MKTNVSALFLLLGTLSISIACGAGNGERDATVSGTGTGDTSTATGAEDPPLDFGDIGGGTCENAVYVRRGEIDVPTCPEEPEPSNGGAGGAGNEPPPPPPAGGTGGTGTVEPPAEEPPVNEPPVQEPPAVEPPAEEPPVVPPPPPVDCERSDECGEGETCKNHFCDPDPVGDPPCTGHDDPPPVVVPQNPCGDDHKVAVCHYPPGREVPHDICIDQHAVDKHLDLHVTDDGHRDYPGPCKAEDLAVAK